MLRLSFRSNSVIQWLFCTAFSNAFPQAALSLFCRTYHMGNNECNSNLNISLVIYSCFTAIHLTMEQTFRVGRDVRDFPDFFCVKTKMKVKFSYLTNSFAEESKNIRKTHLFFLYRQITITINPLITRRAMIINNGSTISNSISAWSVRFGPGRFCFHKCWTNGSSFLVFIEVCSVIKWKR